MSGHSKWHNIKRKKGAEDQKRSQLFSKTSRLIMVAARKGGGDPDANPALRLAIQKAKDARMPKDNIDRAIKKGTGELTGENFQETVYEGYGPHGGAFLLHCLTDNPNRTVSEIRNIFSRYDGSLGAKGSTSYIFNSQNMEPTFGVNIDSELQANKIDEMIDALEDHDDVQDIYHNYKFN
jgi:YebC/PmpR family DNA-binding regulatory protein